MKHIPIQKSRVRTGGIRYLRMLSILCLVTGSVWGGESSTPDGFNNAPWAAAPDEVRKATGSTGWQGDAAAAGEFPVDLGVTVFRSAITIAGYPAVATFYFHENRFFQVTTRFTFDDLKNFDFNYNVYRSVNEYYTAIRSRTLLFVRDIYDLLGKKYGKKEPVFKGLDPRLAFQRLDRYVRQERWNLRYHPYDYYQRIITASYARWDFPKTRVIFSVNISAPDKRFDYLLSLTSLDLEREINRKKDLLRMKGL